MIWNTIPNEEKLRLWKKMRDQIQEFPLEDQLVAIAKFCSTIPFGTRTLDYYGPMTWPTPWEILFYGSFCTSSISLLIFYTLILLPGPKKVELFLVEDDNGVFLLPVVNDQFVLNYELGSISKLSDIQNEIRILQKYEQEQVKSIA
jgi:hypothetical protein